MRYIFCLLFLFVLLSCEGVPDNDVMPDNVITRGQIDSFIIVKKDTVFIHDTIYTSRHYGNVKTINIGTKGEVSSTNQAGGQTSLEINN